MMRQVVMGDPVAGRPCPVQRLRVSVAAPPARFENPLEKCRHPGQARPMDRAFVNAHFAPPSPAPSFPTPGAAGTTPGRSRQGCSPASGWPNDGVSVKTPDTETAGLLIEMGRAERAPYFHRSWVRIPWGSRRCGRDARPARYLLRHRPKWIGEKRCGRVSRLGPALDSGRPT